MKRVDVVYVLLSDEVNEKVLLVKNKGPRASYYTLPGGAVEKGETLQEAALREVKEETGLHVQIGDLFEVTEAFFEERGHHALFFSFFGNIVGGRTEISLPDEIEEITWMRVDEVHKHMTMPADLQEVLANQRSIPYVHRGTVATKL